MIPVPRVVVAGLGPAGPDLITAGTLAAIESAPVVRLRTSRHPAAANLDFETYDPTYERAASFAAVYAEIVDDLLGLAARNGEVLYLVPGSPLVAETTVSLLLAAPEVDCVTLPAMSFLDLAWARLGVDPVDKAIRIVDGHSFDTTVEFEPPLLIAQCSSRSVLSDVKLGLVPEPVADAVLLHHLGLEDEAIVAVPWSEIDRSLEPDHLTSLYVAG